MADISDDIDTWSSTAASNPPAGSATIGTGLDDNLRAIQAAVAAWKSDIDPYSHKNAIINGAFDVWQRGTSFAAIANDAYSADRWQYSLSGSMAHTISRSTDVPTVAQAGRLFNYSLLIDCTTADASIGAGDFCVLQYLLEGYNWAPLAQRSITLSFWVKATKTGTYCVSLQNTGNDRAYVAEYTVSGADTWEKKTITFAASPSAGTWDYTNGRGLKIRWTLAVGSTYQTTAGSWQTGHFIGSANQVNACDDAANNFRLAAVQLELGSAASDFEYRTFNAELALCQRYYWKSFNYDIAPDTATTSTLGSICYRASITGAAAGGVLVQLPVPMRATPTTVFYSVASANAKWRNVTDTADSGDASVLRAGMNSFFIENAQVAGDAAGEFLEIHATAAAEL